MTRQEMIDVAPHLHLRMLADVYDAPTSST